MIDRDRGHICTSSSSYYVSPEYHRPLGGIHASTLHETLDCNERKTIGMGGHG